MDEKRIIKVKHDVNGNPRYVVLFEGLMKYELPECLKKLGWKIYRGKLLGGELMIQSYNINHDFQEALLALKGAAK